MFTNRHSRKRFCKALFVTIFLSACTSTPTPTRQPLLVASVTDFRGLSLKSVPAERMYLAPGRNKMLENGFDRHKTYFLADDDLQISEVTVNEISYDFIDGKLYRINIEFEPDPACRKADILANALDKKYQTRLEETVLPTLEHYWKSSFSNLELVIACTSIFNGGKFFSTTVTISEPSLQREFEEYLDFVIKENKKSSAENAAKDL